MEKAMLNTNGDSVYISVPITKVNEEKRIVSGFATIDNVDQMQDKVTKDASVRAFEAFRGNLREQHDPKKAVGKVVSFSPKELYDEKTGAIYNGIYVDAYVSKGAPDTWEKVLDGTLSGFSIHGPVTSSKGEYNADIGKLVNIVDEYSLIELSLVDSPGNELCNVVSVQKVNGEIELTGIATDVETENVFWCDADQLAVISKSEKENCSQCELEMVNKGWIESGSDDRKEAIEKVLETKKVLTTNTLHAAKGGSEMPEELKVEETVEEVQEVETPVEEPEAPEAEEKVEDVADVTDEPDLANITKSLEEIKDSLSKVHENDASKDEALQGIRETVTNVEKTFQEKFDDLLSKHNELDARVSESKNGINAVEKRLETVEKSSSIKKSLDVEEVEVKAEPKSIFSGSDAFVPNRYNR